eukprot:TRINITY_DN27798_c0_g4_i1.p1 TRINITY_DN27798_c0_g4~~TRINITY_DN27798_c0_g4_i1.p1  ORF type:complete len:163 (+),score=35.49 TRINITY_DN27798_c0_g4_i1:124-612(+)
MVQVNAGRQQERVGQRGCHRALVWIKSMFGRRISEAQQAPGTDAASVAAEAHQSAAAAAEEAPSPAPDATRSSGDLEDGQGCGNGGPLSSGDPNTVGKVRFVCPVDAEDALVLNGFVLNGSPLHVVLDPALLDNTRLVITNLPEGVEWQTLCNLFLPVGPVP